MPAAANKARELRLDSIYAVDGLKAAVISILARLNKRVCSEQHICALGGLLRGAVSSAFPQHLAFRSARSAAQSGPDELGRHAWPPAQEVSNGAFGIMTGGFLKACLGARGLQQHRE